ncbi:single-stranded-DNA-specific exonuclease RecJ [Candidatus Pelagibacter giovannonii]|uniref:Single-stranded-DNA-specific exonuclease RecJ n=1 Tax=Candidatus Pelagibacter giovannonii TaxID=2563896 RepID=A0A6H1Q0C3_9PROT|nr:single-stranded-DNA-specific exonuclease RecJ [Candidatus Pelagibacter giovannonii]QIZ20362.1 single-stranded-DNA-specific exonuclease RecJ [Candidatus Pelagibacter giovannonii]
MISVSGKKWEQKYINQNLVDKLKQDYNFSDILSRLVISRKFDVDEIATIDTNLDLNNVFLKSEDFNQSIKLVVNCINNNEKICILGDYDVDGSAATSLFVKFLESINHSFFYYIPDREKDGYGATKKLFQKLILEEPKLIIMVDCGSTSNEAIDFLNENEIKSLIIDHHEINEPFPKANSIINPKKDNGYKEYDYLCATSLSYFFLDLLIKEIKSEINISDYLIYVLLATVCDVMPLRKLNRLIALNALKSFDIKKNLPLNAIFELNEKKNKININDLGYLIGPILNAGGRLGKSQYATELLSSNNDQVIKERSTYLIKLNNKRKEIETLVLNEIDFHQIEKENKDVIIYYNPNINEGLIGIIAARLKDYFNKPSIVITASNELLKGSARSIYDYNIGRVIKNLLDKNIIINGGGHNMAAGFTLNKGKLKTFQDYILEDFLKSNTVNNNIFSYESELSSSVFDQDFYNDIKKLEPFGTGNSVPIFMLRNLRIINPIILNNKHISLVLKSKTGFSIKSISFNSINTKIGEYLMSYKNNISVIGQINENIWNNKKTLQLTIRDIIL